MDQDFVTEDMKSAMRARTRWGGMLDVDRRQRAVAGAASGTEATGAPLAPRAWWPW